MNGRLPTKNYVAHFWAEPSRELINTIDKIETLQRRLKNSKYAFEIEDTTDACLFFDSNNTLNYEFVFNDGAHNFYKYKRKEF